MNHEPEIIHHEKLFQSIPDPLIGFEVEALSESRIIKPPEKALLAAILKDAIYSIKKDQRYGPSRKGQRQDALDWIGSDDKNWIFSFRSVCEALGFDPDYLRRQIKEAG